MAHNFTLGKNERLKSRKLIDFLFQQGKYINIYPYKVYYAKTVLPECLVLQAGVSAGKRYFKHAVDRNRIKRLTREAYRLKKNSLQQLLKEKNLQLLIFFIYTGKTLPVFAEVSEKMEVVLNKIAEQIVQQS